MVFPGSHVDLKCQSVSRLNPLRGVVSRTHRTAEIQSSRRHRTQGCRTSRDHRRAGRRMSAFNHHTYLCWNTLHSPLRVDTTAVFRTCEASMPISARDQILEQLLHGNRYKSMRKSGFARQNRTSLNALHSQSRAGSNPV